MSHFSEDPVKGCGFCFVWFPKACPPLFSLFHMQFFSEKWCSCSKDLSNVSYFDVISNILMNGLNLRKSYHDYSDFCVYVCSSCVCVCCCMCMCVGGQRWTWGVFLDCTPPYFLRQGVHQACSSVFQLG